MSRALNKRRFGRTGWNVTELGLGCYQLTGEFNVSQTEATAIFDLAFQAGINYFDTAPMYGFGESEELLGRALARHGRQGRYISTKIGFLDRTVVRNLGEDAYRNEAALERVIRHSMWLLRLDHLDALLIHIPCLSAWGIDARTGNAPIMNVLERFKKEGLIRAIGMGGRDCDLMSDLIETDRFDVALVAGGLSLLQQQMRQRLLPTAVRHDVGIVLGGALRHGTDGLINMVTQDRGLAQRLIDQPAREEHPLLGRRLLQLYDLSDETGLGLVELALRYIVGMEAIHTHVCGAREVAHLRANIDHVLNGPLPAEIVARIDAIATLN